MTPRAKDRIPNAYHVSVDNFLSSPKYDELIEQLKKADPKTEEAPEGEVLQTAEADAGASVLSKENIFLNKSFSSKEEAIRFAGEALVRGGYVDKSYVDAMIEREKITTT